MKINNWIPVSYGLFPDDMEDVQVTYLGYVDNKPHCDAFAFRSDGKWHWTQSDDDVQVKITAWKRNCEPYDGK